MTTNSRNIPIKNINSQLKEIQRVMDKVKLSILNLTNDMMNEIDGYVEWYFNETFKFNSFKTAFDVNAVAIYFSLCN